MTWKGEDMVERRANRTLGHTKGTDEVDGRGRRGEQMGHGMNRQAGRTNKSGWHRGRAG